METENISKIATALVRAKLQFKPIDVSLSDKSAHAPLEAILAAITVPLAIEGLVILQPMAIRNDRSILVTTILHESGESIESEILLPVVADVQKFGAILIKYRCFSICSMLAISGSSSQDVDLTPVVTPPDRQAEIKSLISELRLTGSDVNGIMQSWFPGVAKISLLSDQEFDSLKLKLHESANLRQERLLAIS
jgi:hypothetical protein